MNRSGKLFMAMAIAVVPAACKQDRAEEAAENLREQREEVREEAEDVKEALQEQGEGMRERVGVAEERAEERGQEIQEESRELAEETRDLAAAEARFEMQRDQRIAGLRAVHGVLASQPMLINTIAGTVPLTTGARAELGEDMQMFQMRLDEAGNAIEQLQMATAENFDERDDAAEDAMDRLKEARDEAWEALNEGDRVEPS